MIYLASPYTIVNAPVGLSAQALKNRRTRRFKQVCKKAAELMLNGEQVFCPIAHSHPIEVLGMKEVKNGDFWLEQDFAVLAHAKELRVYRMPGWEASDGIRREIAFAAERNIPVTYID
jgi:hypothetical protein